ncbi:MAG: PKD domain-containing protein [Bacteroidales bacterium]|nr:PKD domain-containing protein [Bacteroidales bacterium]
MKTLFLFTCFTISTFFIIGQPTTITIKNFESEYYIMQEIAILNPLKSSENSYYFKIQSPIGYTSFGIGWAMPSCNHGRGDFVIKYRTHKANGKWSEWKDANPFVAPDETPTGLYWTDVLFGIDESQHDSLEFYLYTLNVCNIDKIHIAWYDQSKDFGRTNNLTPTHFNDKSCPPFPTYIPRSSWCGSYTACHNPTYTVSYINPTHAVIHHGASPDTYTDGAAVVRGYWNYHVNTLGWNDIGYNYLSDKFGNLYQGRHNPNYLNPNNYRDVLGAHAGASNSYSIGYNFLGNADVTTPTTIQLDMCESFLAWWFHHYGFDPTSSATIVLQSGGSASKPRICGHKDVNVGGTSCPGNTLYGLLPTIRTETKNKIAACTTAVDNVAPTTNISIDGNVINDWRGTDFWTDFNDYDNPGGSGIDQSFYQVIEYNGTEWRCNTQLGMFNDNFNNTIHPSWTIQSGTWQISNGYLEQTDESLTNPNIYTNLTQTSGNIYLYHYKGRMQGSGTNRRFGFFFFCSDASQTYRGNAYMVYFRADGDNVEIYKSTNNSISGILAQGTYVIDPNIWYDFKVTYNPTTGIIKVYVNDTFVVSYTDSSPLTTGNQISFRTGGCIGQYEDFKVRISRDTRELITVGNQNNKMSRYESPTPSQDACRINTIVKDTANNWSSAVAKSIFIDWTAPTTQIPSLNWQTQDFTVAFSDTDNTNGSGISRRFYQVAQYDGSKWTANSQAGFFYDDFDGTLSPAWTVQTGTWNITNNVLEQTNESLTNTNIWASLKQDLSNRYLYEFDMKIEGSGNNLRGGFHFMCDSATLSNRGNSYFVWFRLSQQTLEFYKVYNDVFEQEKVLPCNIQAGQWYNIKVIFDRITGETFVYMNNILVGEWKDDTPYSIGKYISFRSGNSKLSINNLRVYRTRYPQVTVTTNTPTAHIQYENTNPNTPAAKIASIVTDKAHNLSTKAEQSVNIDFTPPSIAFINDGIGNDIDTTQDNQNISVNWSPATDPNSGITEYLYALGTTPGQDNVVAWTSAGTNTTATLQNLNLSYGQTYYFSVKAINGAGLSTVISSDGFIVQTLAVPVANFYAIQDTLYLPNAIALFVNQSQNATSYLWDFGDGSTSTQTNPWHQYTQIGTYTVTLIAMNPPLPNDTLVLPNYITVLNPSVNNHMANTEMKVFPNPFSDRIHIRFVQPFTGHIDIIDASGKTVSHFSFINTASPVISGIQNLEKGSYFLKVTDRNGKILFLTQLFKQ